MERMRQYQVYGSEFLEQTGRAILADEMGLGKTRQALEGVTRKLWHFPRMGNDKVLILCPKVGAYVWVDEISKWQPDLLQYVQIYQGSPGVRIQMLNDLKAPYILIMTYDILRKDLVDIPEWYTFLILDEAHKIRNRKTKTFKAVQKLASDNLYLLTGTPAREGPQDMWTMLHLIDPKKFGSYWKFVSMFCNVIDGPFGKEIIGPQNIPQLRKLLDQYMIRRKKVEVLKDLPEKTRQLIPVDMEPEQAKQYNSLKDDMIMEVGGELLTASSTLALFVRLRQLLHCPSVLDPSLGVGAGINAMIEMVDDMEDKHFVVFTPFRDAQPIIEDALLDGGLNGNEIFTLRGGMEPDVVKEVVERFEATRGVIICTIKFAQSFNLASASTAFFLGYEFTPDENVQAEDRLHRMTSKSAVTIYYIQHKDSIDERCLEILNTKNQNVTSIFNYTVEELLS